MIFLGLACPRTVPEGMKIRQVSLPRGWETWPYYAGTDRRARASICIHVCVSMFALVSPRAYGDEGAAYHPAN